jgi:putative transcriptional regulator
MKPPRTCVGRAWWTSARCKFDAACLAPVRPLSAEEIRALREREWVSLAVFARYLNVTTGLVSQWERGEKHPQGAFA